MTKPALNGRIPLNADAHQRVRPARPLSSDEVTEFAAAGLTLQVFSTAEDAVRSAADPAGAPRERIAAVLLMHGRLRAYDGAEAVDLHPGSLSLWASPGPDLWQIIGPSVVIRSCIPGSSLPSTLLRQATLPRGPLAPTRLVAAYSALLASAASARPSRMRVESDYLWRALANLEVAVVAEALGGMELEPAAPRARIAEYIDGHLGDPDLGPARIADALGVSVRSVHRSFDEDGVSVARFIREQRLDQVEAALRGEARILRTGALSKRFGFTGPDQLARAFRVRFGMTIQEYVDRMPTAS